METAVLNTPQQSVALPTDKLLDALYFFWDAFDRSSMDFFLVGDTADQARANEDLIGDKVTLGVRELEWKGGQQGIFKSFMEHEGMKPVEKTADYLVFNYHGVPVWLYIYKDNPCLTSLDILFYQNETFKIPNPYKVFVEKYQK